MLNEEEENFLHHEKCLDEGVFVHGNRKRKLSVYYVAKVNKNAPEDYKQDELLCEVFESDLLFEEENQEIKINKEFIIGKGPNPGKEIRED